MESSQVSIAAETPVKASAPCRIDMGGTLDISTFAYSLRHLSPCTFNAAISLRTHVTLLPFERGYVRVASKGFESAVFPVGEAPYDHPLGLIFAVAAAFNADGLNILIDSSSPPQAALGGSSAAVVALIGALTKQFADSVPDGPSLEDIAGMAHGLEASVAGVPCGIQDHLAAAYGGVHAWYWQAQIRGPSYTRAPVVDPSGYASLQRHMLVAYCGVPHASADINRIWIRQFLSGRCRGLWEEIVSHTRTFVNAVEAGDFRSAADAMNGEVTLRRRLTPQVLDSMGEALVEAAIDSGCGARFTGAGGGGCLWAIGPIGSIQQLRERWGGILRARDDATFMDAAIDPKGLIVCG